MLTERDRRLQTALERAQPLVLGVAIALVVVGGGYTSWALLRFDPRGSEEAHRGFDAPVSALTELYRPYRPLLRVARPKTELEVLCMRGLRGNMAFSVGISVTLVRLLLGVLVVLLGVAVLAIHGERRRLLSVIARLRDGEIPPEPAAPSGGGR